MKLDMGAMRASSDSASSVALARAGRARIIDRASIRVSNSEQIRSH
jgi:hypothetical protein